MAAEGRRVNAGDPEAEVEVETDAAVRSGAGAGIVMTGRGEMKTRETMRDRRRGRRKDCLQ